LISTAGGVQPRWRKDGKELFYVASDARLMAMPIRGDTTLEIGSPSPLFKTRVLPHGSQSFGLTTMYDVTADGQRFLTAMRPDEAGAPITVVLNWTAALK
jgi:hypothetical protein